MGLMQMIQIRISVIDEAPWINRLVSDDDHISCGLNADNSSQLGVTNEY